MTLTAGPNVQVTIDTNPHNDRSESSVSANPTDPQNLVGVSKKFTDPSTYQFSLAAVYSVDGGRTWSAGDDLQPVRDILGESIDETDDPVVVFDDLGQAYLLGLALHYKGAGAVADAPGMVVYQSGGSGQTAGQQWSGPTIIHQAPTKDDDKGAMAVDLSPLSRGMGNVYVTWDGTDPNGNQGVLFARTTDHGQSWQGLSMDPPGSLIIAGAHFSAVTVVTSGLFAGRVYVFASPASPGVTYVFSDNGGDSFSEPQMAADGPPFTAVQTPLPGTTLRVGQSAAACADAAGGVLVAWADYRDGVARIYCRHSPDGNTWDGPQAGQPLLDSSIGSSADHHDFMPQLALAPDGSIGCSFYEFGPTPTKNLINTVLVRSADNGQTFTERVTVTDQPWDPTVNPVTDESGLTFIGDYFGLAANSLGFFPFWTDTRTGIQEIFTARVKVERVAMGFQLSKLQWCVGFVDGGVDGGPWRFQPDCTHGDTTPTPIRQKFNVNNTPGQGFAGMADDVVVIVTPATPPPGNPPVVGHIAAPVCMVTEKDTDGFEFQARNSDCQGGECGFYYFAYSTYLGTHKPPSGQTPTPAPSARLLTVQRQLYYPNCQPGDTWDATVPFWNPLPSLGGVFLTACDSGVTGCDFPTGDAWHGGPAVQPHNAAAVGIVRPAGFTQFTLHSRNSDTAGGECAFYAFAISQPVTGDGQKGDAGSLFIDSGTVLAADLLGEGYGFYPSGQLGDTKLFDVYFHQPYLTPPVVFLIANNVGVENVPHNAFAVGIAQNVTPNGFLLRARNSDCAPGPCGFYWVAIGCSPGCG